LAGREALTLHDLVQETIAATGLSRLIVPLPVGLVRAAVRLHNAAGRRPRVTVEQVDRLEEDKHFDYSAARDDFGFAPRSFRDGVRAEVELVRQELHS
jgi:nucleoside-diphosphate-sugar epimerase